MSMMGNFRQVSPELLERIKADPSLVERVIQFRGDRPQAQSDVDAFISLLPANMRKSIEKMPEAARAGFLAYTASQISDMPDTVKSQIADARRGATGQSPPSNIDPADVGVELDLEKAWHGLHFLLSGSVGPTADPLGQAIIGGKEIGEDLGYGPARYLGPSEVKAVAAALAALTPQAIADRFEADALEEAQIYPNVWADDEEECRQWLSEAFSELQAFYASAAEKGFAALLYIV